MIKRNIQEYLIKLLEYFPVVGILGARQVGKTTLAKEIESVLNVEVSYIDLESTSDIVKITDPELFFENNKLQQYL